MSFFEWLGMVGGGGVRGEVREFRGFRICYGLGV